MKLYVVIKDGKTTIRTTPVSKKYTEGPSKDCDQIEVNVNPIAARALAAKLAA